MPQWEICLPFLAAETGETSRETQTVLPATLEESKEQHSSLHHLLLLLMFC
jgi:hypothetical protein